MGLLEVQHIAQTGVLTGNGVSLTGNVLHFGDVGLQRFVFRLERFITEHIAVILLGSVHQSSAGSPEGGHHALDDDVGQTLVGDACHNGQTCCQQNRKNQNNAHLGAE